MVILVFDKWPDDFSLIRLFSVYGCFSKDQQPIRVASYWRVEAARTTDA